MCLDPALEQIRKMFLETFDLIERFGKNYENSTVKNRERTKETLDSANRAYDKVLEYEMENKLQDVNLIAVKENMELLLKHFALGERSYT